MIDRLDIAHVLFLDIETVSGKPTYDDLDETFKELWKLKCRGVLKKYDEEITDEEAAATYLDKAGIFAEFGKIVCISVGIVRRDKDKNLSVRLKSFANDDEKILLEEFSALVNQYYDNPTKHGFCGHNIREFDIPYICRRMVVNQLPFPNTLNLSGKKPWETKHLIDTLELWKFGDYKHYTSLKLLAAVLGFPSPKDDIDGSNVGRVYWEEQDLERIAVYCEKDVLATVQLYLRYRLMPLIEQEQVIHVDA
jgi:hypothetical protein